MSAEHELHLVKNHERQQKVVIQRAEDGQHHGGSHGQTLLGAAEYDGDAVLTLEVEQVAADPGCGEGEAEDDDACQHEASELGEFKLIPITTAGGVGESGVNHQPDGEPVIPANEGLVSQNPLAQNRLAELPRDERQ